MEQKPKIEDANLLLVYEGLKLSVKTGQTEEQTALDTFNKWYPEYKISNFEGLEYQNQQNYN